MYNTHAIRTHGSKNFFVENGDFYVGTTANNPTATDAPVYYFKRDGSLYASNIKAASGRVNNLFVEDELRALHYNIQTVADLGGTFIVAPTLYCSANATFQVSAINGTTITATINDASSIDSDTLGGATWKANSQIKISGSFGGVVIGTCSGHLTANMNASAGTMKIQFTYDAQSINPLSVKTYAANEISDLHVMLTTVYDQTDNPVGIYMTSYDANKRSHISLYGGTDTKPTVRIGNLQGLDAINNVTPTGWGIYTNNGFFSGVIVSNSGKIGDFTISDALYSSTHSDYNTNVDGIYIGSDYISFGKQGVTYFKPDGTGKIGAWNVSATAFSNGTYGSDSSVYISTANMASKAIGGRTGADWRLTVGSHFGVTNTGAFYANSANVTGTINATTGTFGNGTYKITVGNGGTANSAIRYGMSALADTTNNGFYIGTDGIALGKGAFRVNADGSAVFKNATLGDPNAYHVGIDSDSVDIYNSNDKLASFGSTTVVGNSTFGAITINSNGLSGIGDDSVRYFNISSFGKYGSVSRDVDPLNGTVTGTETKEFSINFPELSNNKIVFGLTVETGIVIPDTNIVWNYIDYVEFTYGYPRTESTGDAQQDDIAYQIRYDGNKTFTINWTRNDYNNYHINIRYYENHMTPFYLFGVEEIGGENGTYAFLTGFDNKASGNYSFVSGYKSSSTGEASRAGGQKCAATGLGSTAEGLTCTASGEASHAEGKQTKSRGEASHAEGAETTAQGKYSHAEGYRCYSSGEGSHAEGESSDAMGLASHAGGWLSNAFGNYSFVHGMYVTSGSDIECQTVIGKWNRIYDEEYSSDSSWVDTGNFAFIIGNGTGDSSSNDNEYRSNALEVDWNGFIQRRSLIMSSDSNVTAPSSNTTLASNSYYDINDHQIGYDQIVLNTSNNLYRSFAVTRQVNNATTTHAMYMGIETSGDRYVSFSDPQAWRNGLGLKRGSSITRTYTSNSYVNQTNFNRLAAYQIGNFVYITGNLSLSAAMPKSSDWVTIGSFSITPNVTWYESVAGCGAGSNIPALGVQITTGGVVQIYNYSNTSAPSSAWYRFTAIIPIE